MAKIILFFILASGCIHNQTSDPEVTISSFNMGGLRRSQPICFTQTDVPQGVAPIEYKSTSDEVIRICTIAAKRKSVLVTNYGNNCIAGSISWLVTEAGADNPSYSKRMVIQFFGNDLKNPMHEIKAVLTTSNPGMMGTTATALCRAAFAEYPATIKNKIYLAKTDFDDMPGSCPQVGDEPVSVCRAELACGKGKASTAIGMILSGMGAGLSHQRNMAVDNYNDCIDRNLRSQKANAGIPDNSVRCVSQRTSADEVRTDCR